METSSDSELKAYTFLNNVKQTFSDRPQIYNKFIEMMKELQGNSEMVPKITDVLNGYPDLLEGFNYFLNPNDLTSHMCTGRQEAMKESLENKSKMCDICDVCDKSFTNFDIFKSHICEVTDAEGSIVGNFNDSGKK